MLSVVTQATAKESETWSYVGRGGPDKWSELDQKFSACSEGVMQSPIDLDDKKLLPDKAEISFYYDVYQPSAKDYSIKLANQDKHIKIGDRTFKLIQFHFHMPSEHSINGQVSRGEVHFVHQDDAGNLAVVGVNFKEGKSNPLMKRIIDAYNGDAKTKYALEDGNISNFLPANREYFHYMGSLTTTPCTEGVNWYVLKEAVEASKEELSALDKLMPDNARPIQESNGRVAQ
jgi:carbonic anhydrase